MAEMRELIQPRIYLAGPEVFLPNAHAMGTAKCAICAEHGLTGVFPLDGAPDLDGLRPAQKAQRISLANEELMRSCAAIIANMTPFRGAAMDSGTAFEVGFMRALERPVFGYSNTSSEYIERARTVRGQGLASWDYDADDLDIEDFGLAENLMIAVAVSETGPDVVRHEDQSVNVREDLSVFTQAVASAARVLIGEA